MTGKQQAVLVMMILLVGCSDAPGRSAEAGGPLVALSEIDAPVWDLGDSISLMVGTEGEAPYQLDRVRGALRLPNGNVVVLDGGSSELRFFDATGRHIKTAGGKGDGPGEFQTPWTMYRRADTIFVVDSRLKRLSALTAAGEFLESTSGDPHGGTGNVYLLDESIVIAPPGGGSYEEIDSLIQQLPRPKGHIRDVRVAGPGSVWVQSDTSRTEWIVFDHTGNATGRASLPDNFSIAEVGRGYVVGVSADSLGVESVHVLNWPEPEGPERTKNAPLPASMTGGGSLEGLLDRVHLYQEHYYSRPDGGYVYATSMEDLSGFAPAIQLDPLAVPPNVAVRITQGGRMGWFAVATDTVSGMSCATGNGFTVPTGWSNGAKACF